MINIAVEGESDREAAKAVVRAAGHKVNIVRVAGGKTRLDPLVRKYNQASRQTPWVVFRDSDSQCPVAVRTNLLDGLDLLPNFRLRVAHSMAEAWLLADPDSFSSYFDVPRNRIPDDPESLEHAKRSLLGLCANSRSRAIRQEVVATDGGAGPLYVSRINDYASTAWNPSEAGTRSESLTRAIDRIREIPV